MRLSVVVRALNEEEHIGRLLTGLARQRRDVDEIVLVDSGSTDATVEIASRFGARIVHIDPAEFSFGRSLNLGMQAATGDVVVIPSAHVYPVDDAWIANLVAPFDDPAVGMSYGRQVGDRVTKYSEHRVLAQWFPEMSEHDQAHPFANNANAAVRRSVWEEHRYDERLTGLEDLDFARRIQQSGWKVSYVAEAVIVHVHEETWDQVRNRYRREAIAHRRIFDDQQMSLAETAKLIGLNVARDARMAAREGVLGSTATEILRFRVAQFVGTYQGFRQSGPVREELKRRFYYPSADTGRSTRSTPPTHGTPIDYGSAEESP